MHGTLQLDTNDKGKVDSFIKKLSEAITSDMAEFRETEFDRPGGYRHVSLEFENDSFDGEDDVLVDRFGRLVVPNEMPWTTLKAVKYPDESFLRPIVKKEVRFLGDHASALVVYVEDPENIKAQN